MMVAAAALLASACATNVPQDRATGADGRQEGARALVLENDEGRARGIVTYPGGDRVDWKVIELPARQSGTLALKLRWTPPRPGLDLSFEVYDASGHVVGSAEPIEDARSRPTAKTIRIPDAHGTVFVQIYASARGDAGRYTLLAEWEPNER
jgi:hypothetical protein